MKITLNNQLENPTAFFEFNGNEVALDLVENMLYAVDEDGLIYGGGSDDDFEVEQDYEAEETLYVFEDFVIVSSCGEVSVRR